MAELAISALFVLLGELIARTTSGGTVKTCPPMAGVQIAKESLVFRTSTATNSHECQGILLKNPLLANQLKDALSVLENWEVK